MSSISASKAFGGAAYQVYFLCFLSGSRIGVKKFRYQDFCLFQQWPTGLKHGYLLDEAAVFIRALLRASGFP
ncbi:hypothetical protein SDJN03_04352, partial [Cucurbita argyrosperma subsp. sororia]